MTIKPFIKWAGGKTSLLPTLAESLPHQVFTGEITTYIEPFLGGGAFFLWLLQHSKIEKFNLSDSNPSLINAWRMVKYFPDELIEALEEIEKTYLTLNSNDRAKCFYTVREEFNQSLKVGIFDSIPHAARFIFLNKTCFNGLYRLNKKGSFNVPHGSMVNPSIVNADNIRELSNLLNEKSTIFFVSDFSDCSLFANSFTLTYFDPPYRPINRQSFKNYSANAFTEVEHIDLARLVRELPGYKMLSNSFTDDGFSKRYYRGCELQVIECARSINSKATERGKIKEILVTKYN